MNAATSLKEYVEISMKELVESSTNPRKPGSGHCDGRRRRLWENDLVGSSARSC
jgi:hypothetical protein